jgi:arylsulfatase
MKDGSEGVIVAEGGTAGGYVLRVKDGKLIYEYNFFGKERTKIESSDKLPSGKVAVAMEYTQKTPDISDPARGGSGGVKQVVPARFSATETLDIGNDLGSTVSESYKAPHSFTGTIEKVVIKLK